MYDIPFNESDHLSCGYLCHWLSFDPFGEVIGSYQKKGILLVEEGDYRLGIF